ncbi:MAG: metal ABC transporter permease [Oscillospiraceae bacterium]|nr:metal ABC transporter permease [Oscillospiraceae bacterium]
MMDFFLGWWQYEFMRYAFFAILLIMPLFALLGTMVVNNGMAFFSDALGHSSLTGVGVGIILGMSNYKPAMVIFAVVFALLMNKIRHSRLSSTDTVIGVFSSCGVALGLIFMSYKGSFSRYQSLLIGDILSVTRDELVVLAVILPIVALLWVVCFNRFHSISISPELAGSRGIPVRLLDNLFVAVVAVVVMLAIHWVGLLIINAMLILPAAAARHVAKNTRSYLLTALAFGLFSGFFGLWLSYSISVAAGPAIVLISAILYFATFIVREKR